MHKQIRLFYIYNRRLYVILVLLYICIRSIYIYIFLVPYISIIILLYYFEKFVTKEELRSITSIDYFLLIIIIIIIFLF